MARNTDKIRGRWGLVTGASSGIGADFCRLLAEEGMHLVLVARREDRLKALADELRTHGVVTRIIALDLARPDAAAELKRRTDEAGLEIDLLVNNAGFGLYGPDLEIPWEREHEMLELDIVAVVDLTKRYARDMVRRGRGWIIQVASVGAYQASPTYAAYSAAKAFVLSYGEALAYELRGTGVSVTVLSPGVTRTEFLEVSGQAPAFYHRLTMMDPRAVTKAGLDAVLRGRPSVIPGLVNKIAAFSLRFMPRRWQAVTAHLTMKPD
ncbi:MAG TPA: SDR family oxidoreductase [Deltaproteobacteria bacterium]|nr:SDR family oxidoreductase [Deltaproteobacteria bacterium]